MISETIKLNVPLIHQPKGSDYCTISSGNMLVAFLGDKVTTEEMVNSIFDTEQFDLNGITPRVATFMVNRGYNVFYTTYSSKLITKELKNKTQKDISLFKEKIFKLEMDEKNRKIVEQLEFIVKFMEAGGKFSSTLATLETIDDYLSKNIPVSILVRPSVLYQDVKIKRNHTVVITGKDNDKYEINDPSTRFDNPYKIEKGRLFEAWNPSNMLVAIQK